MEAQYALSGVAESNWYARLQELLWLLGGLSGIQNGDTAHAHAN